MLAIKPFPTRNREQQQFTPWPQAGALEPADRAGTKAANSRRDYLSPDGKERAGHPVYNRALIVKLPTGLLGFSERVCDNDPTNFLANKVAYIFSPCLNVKTPKEHIAIYATKNILMYLVSYIWWLRWYIY